MVIMDAPWSGASAGAALPPPVRGHVRRHPTLPRHRPKTAAVTGDVSGRHDAGAQT